MLKKERIQYIVFAAIVAFSFLTICSRSSFIYIFNNWDDANSYFTMGKVMMNGGVIYRDSFDQKGPLLYFIYGIAYLISHTTFWGVFIMEMMSFTLFLMAIYKIAVLYVKHIWACFTLPFVALVVTASQSFYWGGSAEEFCLPFLAWALYLSMRYFKEGYPEKISRKTVFVGGILAGCIMLIKYTVLGLCFFWMAMIAFSTFNKKNWKTSVQNCVVFLLGMGTPLIPWLIYFGIQGALGDWYHAYIYCNVFLYSDFNQEAVGIGKKIYDLAKILYWLIWDNFIYFSMIILGFVGFLFTKKARWFEKINVLGMFGFLFLGIFIGGTTLFYYSLPLSLFSVFGVTLLASGLEKWMDKILVHKKAMIAVGTCAVIGSLFFAWNFSMNTDYAKETPEDYYLYKMRDVVLQEENPTLLNIGCLDAGLYTMTGIVPNCKYFQTNAVNGFEEVREEQLRYIKEGEIQFVLARGEYPEQIWDNYELVCEEEYLLWKEPLTYYLFQKK